MVFFFLVVIAAFLLDLLLGDPRWLPHPIRFIGFGLTKLESGTRKTIKKPLVSGSIMVIMALFSVSIIICLLLVVALQIHTALFYLLSTILLYTTFATKDLLIHSLNIYNELTPILNIDQARMKLSWIVGRETANLDCQQICRASVESVAENLVDGVTAPMFWAILLSFLAGNDPVWAIILAVLGAMLYKTVNTMDSMFGYKDEKYIYFGRCAARLDDVANFIPARTTGLILLVSSLIHNKNTKNAIKVFFRDRQKHSSPNAGHPEAAVSGALGIRLGGSSTYKGKVIIKPILGDELCEIEPRHILDVNKLMLTTSVVYFAILLLIRSSFTIL